MKYLFLFLLITNIGFAQVNNPTNVNKYIADEATEKVILHSDRDIYLSGEKIWFNAYCFIPEQTSEHHLSNILYVELYNNSREFITKRKFEISKEKNIYGSIDIPSEFLSGNYYIRAYTQFLKNYAPETYFTSLITIINPLTPLPESAISQTKQNIEISIHDGLLIEGVKSKINFNINNNLEQQLIKAVVVNQENSILSEPLIAEAKGAFEITPQKGSTYTIKLLLENNDSITQTLPAAAKNGLIIRPQMASNNQLLIDIINKNDRSDDQNYYLNIRSQNEKMIVERKIDIANELTQLSFSGDILDQGLNYIILTDEHKNILKLAAVYKKHNILEIELNTSKQTYAQRELVQLDISSPVISSKQLTNVSVSVVKKGSANNSSKLLPYILQQPQLIHSYIQDPNNTYSLTQKQIDRLMIKYNAILSQMSDFKLFNKNMTNFKWLPEIRDVSISGLVYDKKENTPIADVPVYVSAFKENPQVHIFKTLPNGEFVFSLNNLVDKQNIYISTKPYEDGDVAIQIYNDFSQTFPPLNEIPLAIDTTDQELLEEMYINMQAGEIFKTKTGANQLPKIDMPFNLGESEITTVLDDYVSSPNLKSIFEDIIPNIRVRRKDNKSILSIFDTEKKIYYEDPLALVDNIPIFDIDEFLKVPPKKIDRIDLIKTPLVIGNELIKGIVMLTTNTDNFGGVKTSEGSVFLEYQTVSASYGFDPPIYNTPEKRSNRLADFRNLLYWNPTVNISKKTSVSFYTSDYCSDYDVIVRGYDSDGKEYFGKTSLEVVPDKK